MRKVLFVLLLLFSMLSSVAAGINEPSAGGPAGVSNDAPNSDGVPAAPSCTGRQLTLAGGDEDADMGGKRYISFTFTNTSSKPCTLSGYPTLVPLNRAGKILSNVGVTYSNDYPNSTLDKKAARHVVTLAPGKKALFQIYYNDGMALSHRKAFPKVSKVRITAPKDKKAFVLKSEFTTCCGVQVSSIRKDEPQ